MNTEEVIQYVEKSIGYVFTDKRLLLDALTHTSYANEMRINKRPSYERLEFLGDAVLQLLSSEYLFDKYKDVPEGGLSKKRASMVCESSLAVCARRMGFGEAIFFGKGESQVGRDKDSILADVVEAVLGAIYLDSGIESARLYVMNNVLADIHEDELFVDYKSAFQEMVQVQGAMHKLSYELVGEYGPEHDKVFEEAVLIDSDEVARGKGRTKKAAQQKAAYEALKRLQKGNL